MSRPMRIVYLWDADYPWDVRTEKVTSALAAAGHDVKIVARNKGWAPERESREEGEVHRMTPWKLLGRRADNLLSFPAFFNPRWIGLLAKAVRESAADLIIVRDLPLCPTALIVGRVLGVPVVLDMAENYAAMMRATWVAGRQGPFDLVIRNPRIVAAVERFCLPMLARTLVVVEESGERLAELGLPAQSIAVVSNTPPRSHVGRENADAPTRPGGRFIEIIYLGMMEIPRGVGDLFEAAALMKRAGVRFRLRLIGSGRDLELFRNRVVELGLEEETVFHGYVARAEALEMIRRADVGIVPHHADEAWNTTIPNKLFDYMAAGLPVVSSNTRPCERILHETGAGLVFSSGDAESLSAVLSRLTDPSLRWSLGAAGKRAILERYNWEADSRVLLETVEAFSATPRTAKLIPPSAPTVSSATR